LDPHENEAQRYAKKNVIDNIKPGKFLPQAMGGLSDVQRKPSQKSERDRRSS